MLYKELEGKTNQDSLEQKSISPIGESISFPEFLLNSGEAALSAYAAITLYQEAMPFFNAVNMRATAFGEIPVRLYDKSTDEYVDSHPALDLINNPNADEDGMEFLYGLSSFFDITGEVFMLATGRTSGKPLELVTRSPAFATFGQASSQFGILNLAENITIQSRQEGGNIFKIEEQEGRIRYINSKQDKELWHVRSFNPRKSAGIYRGVSKAKPLWLELQQYVSGNRTNLSTLKRGTRLSMAWVNSSDTALTPVQFERMQQEAQKYSGDSNAGGTPILDGMDVKTIQQTNKDMEFQKLQDAMLSRCSNVYGVPLALLLDSSMTLNNLETSILHFYDLAVLPHAKRLYKEMSRFILPRFPNSENLVFKYNEQDIPAVRARLVAAAKEQNSIGVNSVDEVREMIGDEPLGNGEGDVILVAGTHKTLGQVIEGEPDPVEPAPLPEPAPDKEESPFQIFSFELRKCLNDKGERVYTDEYIAELAMEKGLFDGD